MIGGAALLADGIITPPITITSAIEGLKEIPSLANMEQSTIVAIVIGILALFFSPSNLAPIPSDGLWPGNGGMVFRFGRFGYYAYF